MFFLLSCSFLCSCVFWLCARCQQHVLSMCASQLSYSCVVWPLHLITYSLRCHTAGWLCSLQLVFHFSPHLACLNKTVSILKALSYNHPVTPHKVMATAGRCSQSLNKTPPKSQYQNLCKLSALSCESRAWNWLTRIFMIFICMKKVKYTGKRSVTIRLYLRYFCKMWLKVLRYVWTKPFALLAQHSLGFLLNPPRFYPGYPSW